MAKGQENRRYNLSLHSSCNRVSCPYPSHRVQPGHLSWGGYRPPQLRGMSSLPVGPVTDRSRVVYLPRKLAIPVHGQYAEFPLWKGQNRPSRPSLGMVQVPVIVRVLVVVYVTLPVQVSVLSDAQPAIFFVSERMMLYCASVDSGCFFGSCVTVSTRAANAFPLNAVVLNRSVRLGQRPNARAQARTSLELGARLFFPSRGEVRHAMYSSTP